jgi:hypothetical protein
MILTWSKWDIMSDIMIDPQRPVQLQLTNLSLSLLLLLDGMPHLQGVTEALINGRAALPAELSACKAALERLHNVLGQKGLDSNTTTTLLLFVFRPFTAHLLSNICSSTAPCIFAFLLLLQQVLEKLGASLDPAEQKKRTTLAATLLTDLSTCSFYNKDPTARQWLKQNWKLGLHTYIKGNSHCPNKPVSPQQGSSDSSCTSGLQALIDLLGYSSGKSATSVDGVLRLAERLLSCAPQLPRDLQLQHLWALWLTPQVIRQVVTDGSSTGSNSTAVPLAAAVGATSFQWHNMLADQPSRLPGGELKSVTWSDGSHQATFGADIPPRHSPFPVLSGVLSRSSSEEVEQHLQVLPGILQQALSNTDTTGLPPGHHQQHAVWCMVELFHHAAQLAEASALQLVAEGNVPKDQQQQVQKQQGSAALLPAVAAVAKQIISAQHVEPEVVVMQQHLGLQLAQMLLHQPLSSSALRALLEVVDSVWPLPDQYCRRQWLRGTPSPASPSTWGSAGQGPGGGVAVDRLGNSGQGGFCQALAEVPSYQQLQVLHLLYSSLQAWPSDVLQLPVQQLTAVVLDVLVNVADEDKVHSASSSSRQQQMSDPLDLVSALLMQLDGGSGAAYHVLILQLLPDSTSAVAAEDATDVEPVRKARTEHCRRTAAMQLLGLALQSQQGACGVTSALLGLVQQPGSAELMAVAAGALLLWHCTKAMPLAPVLKLLADISTTSAPLDVLVRLASVDDCLVVQILLQLAQAATSADAASTAPWLQHQGSTSLEAAGHLQEPLQEQVVLVLARLVPHVADPGLMTAVLQCLLLSIHPPAQVDIFAATEATAASSRHLLARIFLQPKEQTAVLQVLCNLDAATEAAAGQAETQGWLHMYFLQLLKQLEDDRLHHQEQQTVTTQSVSAGRCQAPGALQQLQHLGQLLHDEAVHNGDLHRSRSAATSVTARQPREQLHRVIRAALMSAHLPALAALLAADADTAAVAAGCLLRLLPGFTETSVQQVLAQMGKRSAVEMVQGSASGGLMNAAFFSTEQAGKQHSQQRTHAEDFKRLSNLLEAHVQRARAAAASTSAAGARHSTPLRLPVIGGRPASSRCTTSESFAGVLAPEAEKGLVMTPTTLDNINRVLDVVDNPAPLLLEGPTGVGKSATVTEAARRHGKCLVRFNMSSAITPDDLLGRVMMKAAVGTPGNQADQAAVSGDQQQGFVLEHQLQPFAAAFAAGDWLLLDELNLAPDDVLQCIEQALDMGVCDKHLHTAPLSTDCHVSMQTRCCC